MTSSAIDYIARIFPNNVYKTDAELERRFGNINSWIYLTEGGESEVYTTRSEEFVIKKSLPLSENEYDYDDEEVDSIQDGEIIETIQRVKRLIKELALPDNDNITKTLYVSPSYTVEKKKDTDLRQYMINSTMHPSLTDKLLMCKDIYSGLLIIHSMGMAHLDIKPENIFVNGRSLSIGDFGHLSRCLNHTGDAIGATPGWRPPSFSSKRCKQVDLFSAAIVVMGILSWDHSIIDRCREFSDTINAIRTQGVSQQSINHELCQTLGQIFDNQFQSEGRLCFPDFNTLSPHLLELLKRSILGIECNIPLRITSSSAIKTLDRLISKI